MKLKSLKVYLELVLRIIEDVWESAGEPNRERSDTVLMDNSDTGLGIFGLASAADIACGIGMRSTVAYWGLVGVTADGGVEYGACTDADWYWWCSCGGCVFDGVRLFLKESLSRSLPEPPGVVAVVPPLELRSALYRTSDVSLAA